MTKLMTIQRLRRLALLVTIFVLSFSFGRLLVVAQVWSNPNDIPPINNAGQPPDAASLSAYVLKSETNDQFVQGPVNVATEMSYPSDFGEDGGLSSMVSAIANGTDSSVVMYADDITGVYPYGVGMDYGLFGYANSASGTTTGVLARGTNGALAARFYGPVVGADSATTTVTSTVSIDQGITCLTGTCSIATPDWITVTHTNDGTAVYGQSTNSPGVDIDIDDAVVDNGYGIDAYSLSGYGAVGYGRPGVYAFGESTLSKRTYGLYASHAGVTTGSSSYIGVHGVSTGGLGTAENYGSNATPQYDFGAGIRACWKDENAAITNDQGIEGIGSIAGYFDGDGTGTNAGDVLIMSVCSNDSFVQCSSDSDCGAGTCEGRLKIGSTYLTQTNLRGVICKLNGTPAATCHATTCGNGTLEPGEECDDGNTTNGDGCSSACTTEVGYSYRRSISFAGAGSGTFTDVPLLIHLEDGVNFDFSKLSFADGTDIALYDQSLTLLDFEIEKITSTDAWIWFRYPSYNRVSPDSIWIYYGNAAASNIQNPEGVWRSDFAGVWHMSEDPSISTDGNCGGGDKELCDSTSNSNDGDSVGTMTAGDLVTGSIGDAIVLDGVDDYFNIPHDSSFNITTDFTISFWMKPDAVYPDIAWPGIIAKTDGSTTWDYDIFFGDSLYLYGDVLPSSWYAGSLTFSVGNWHHIVLKREGTAWKWFMNGVARNFGTDGTAFSTNSVPLRIGTDGPEWDPVGSLFEGSIDEVWLLDSALNDQIISTHYQNMIGSLVTIGSEQTL